MFLKFILKDPRIRDPSYIPSYFLNKNQKSVSLQFLNLKQLVGLLGWGISPSQGRYSHRTTHTA
jgi:hypothetical protein